MNLNPYFKSVLDQDRASIVLCGLDHTILYMNPAAIRSYAKHGGTALVGRSLANCHNAHSNEMIQTVVDWFAASPEHNLIYTYHNEKQNKDVYMVALRDEDGTLIGYYEKHEYRDPETLEPVEYYCKLPPAVSERDVSVVDPMFATGGSASAAISFIKKRGCSHIRLVNLIAAPEGIKRMQEDHPDVDIYVAGMDDHLNEHGYIVPGLGDAGDRLFGTK